MILIYNEALVSPPSRVLTYIVRSRNLEDALSLEVLSLKIVSVRNSNGSVR